MPFVFDGAWESLFFGRGGCLDEMRDVQRAL